MALWGDDSLNSGNENELEEAANGTGWRAAVEEIKEILKKQQLNSRCGSTVKMFHSLVLRTLNPK